MFLIIFLYFWIGIKSKRRSYILLVTTTSAGPYRRYRRKSVKRRIIGIFSHETKSQSGKNWSYSACCVHSRTICLINHFCPLLPDRSSCEPTKSANTMSWVFGWSWKRYQRQIGPVWIGSNAQLVSFCTKKKKLISKLIVQFGLFRGGFLVKPHTFEFWQGQTNRLHDRIQFRSGEECQSEVDDKLVHSGENGWVYERLAP